MIFFKFGKWLVASVAVLSVLALAAVSQLQFGFNLEKLYPVKDGDRMFFKQFQERFHTAIDEEYIFIGLTNREGIFDQKFLEKVDRFSRQLDSLEPILDVYSITRSGYLFQENGRLQQAPLIHISEPGRYATDSAYLFQSREYTNLMVSNDGKSIAISAINKPGLTAGGKDNLLQAINDALDDLKFDRHYLTAKIRVEREYVREIEKNLKTYIGVAIVLISIVLFFFFRTGRGIIVPLVAIILSICWTLALIVLTGHEVDVISSLIPPIIAVICVSTIVHILSAYSEAHSNASSREDAWQTTLKEVGPALFFAVLTTSVGFYSLATTNIASVRQFGLFAGTGIWFTLIVGISLVYLAYGRGQAQRLGGVTYFSTNGRKFLFRSFSWLLQNKSRIPVLYLLLLVLMVVLASRIQIDSSLLQEIPRNSPMLEDYRFVEEEFAGTRSFEMALMPKDTSKTFLDLELLKQVEALEQYLKDSSGVGFLISPLTFFKGANRAYGKGYPEMYRLPARQQTLYYYYDQVLFSPWAKDLVRYLTPDRKHARIGGKLPDVSTRTFETIEAKLEAFLERSDFDFEWKLTGSAMLIDKISYFLIDNMLMGLLIAFSAISLVVLYLFRSFTMIFIVLICNIVPLLFMAGMMGLLNIHLKADTSVIFAVAFGIVVDDTIHFIGRFRTELRKGKAKGYALKRAYLSTGRAMSATTVILISGFGALLFSSFGGTFNIGLLVCIGLLVALITDLTLLPALILMFYRPKPLPGKT